MSSVMNKDIGGEQNITVLTKGWCTTFTS